MQNKRGQAILELAILGSLLFLGFSVILTYGQRMSMQQQLKMEAFRKALQKAYTHNNSVSYTVKKDARLISLFGGYGQGQDSAMGASASVMWQKGAPGVESADSETSFAFYEVNGQIIEDPNAQPGDRGKGLPRIEKRVIGYDGSDRDIEVPVGIWKEETAKKEVYRSEVVKGENAEGFTNTRTSDFQGTAKGNFYTRMDTAVDEKPWDDEEPLPEYDYEIGPGNSELTLRTEQGAYFRRDINRVEYSPDEVGKIIRRTRTWQTQD